MTVHISAFRKGNTEYHHVGGQTLHFEWFKVNPTLDQKISTRAKDSIIYWNGDRWQVVTGLVPISKRYKNVFAGDILGETAAIILYGDIIEIRVFKGHRVKRLAYRVKKVKKYIRAIEKQRGAKTIV